MNMQKALQNLYKAITNEDNHKVNISKLLVDIHYGITGEMPTVKNNWSRIIDSLATNWPEGGGGGDLTYANVKANFVGENNPTGFSYSTILIKNDAFDDCVRFEYGSDYGLPLSDLGSVTNIKVPVYKNYKTDITTLTFAADGGYLLINTPECSVVSGDAEIDEENQMLISGDCELNLTLNYAD